MNIETFKKILTNTPNQCFMHVGHPFGSGVLYAIQETVDNVMVVHAEQIADEYDMMDMVNQLKGKTLTIVVTDVNRMMPRLHEPFMREFFFNFPTNFENSRLILLTNYEYKSGDDPAYESRELPFMDVCVYDKFCHYYIEKEEKKKEEPVMTKLELEKKVLEQDEEFLDVLMYDIKCSNLAKHRQEVHAIMEHLKTI